MVRVTKRAVSRSLEGSHEDGLQNVFNGEGTDVSHGAPRFSDGGEMTVDIALGVAVPAHHAGDFAGKQNSLHALVVKWEGGEESFPYLLGTQLLRWAMGVKNFHRVCNRGPEIVEAAIYDVIKCVTVVLVKCHPGSFLGIVDCKVFRGDKLLGENCARQSPTKPDAEGLERGGGCGEESLRAT